jgi:hypothetical protein
MTGALARLQRREESARPTSHADFAVFRRLIAGREAAPASVGHPVIRWLEELYFIFVVIAAAGVNQSLLGSCD